STSRPQPLLQKSATSRPPDPRTYREHCSFFVLNARGREAPFAVSFGMVNRLVPKKSPGRSRGLSIRRKALLRSVAGDDRTAELVVDAGGEEIDVLLDVVGAGRNASRRDERVILRAHEHVIVLDAGRPVRREAVLEADADHAAPTGLAG